MNGVSLQQLEPIVSLGIQLVALSGVAALGVGVSRAVAQSASHHSIPRGELRRIADSYGWWAARRAEAFCPENDVACVEREAKRLYEVSLFRR